jgi:hypothetical protein
MVGELIHHWIECEPKGSPKRERYIRLRDWWTLSLSRPRGEVEATVWGKRHADKYEDILHLKNRLREFFHGASRLGAAWGMRNGQMFQDFKKLVEELRVFFRIGGRL